MIRKRLAAATAAIALLCIFGVSGARTAFAWNADGHKQIADIAWMKLTPAAKRKIQTILFGASEASYRPSETGEAAIRRAFRVAAVFPDDIKRNGSSTAYATIIEQENRAFPIDLPSDNREAVLCKTWHYYDTPIRLPKGSPTPKLDPSNALAALTRAEEKLKSLSASGDVNSIGMQFWYLAWIEHIVGDLHQPLHCVSSYEFSPTGDAGGNGFHLAPDENGRPVVLHYLWDSGIAHAADYHGRPNEEYAAVSARWIADPALQPAPADAGNLDIKSWIDFSARLADTQVYTGIAPDQAPSADYLKREDDLSRRQAVLAGYRLAAVLNKILGS